MNHNVEKWLTIAAFTGWIGSIGSLLCLAIESAPLAALRPQQPQQLAQLEGIPSVSLKNEIAQTQIPGELTHDFWIKSLRSPSQPLRPTAKTIANR